MMEKSRDTRGVRNNNPLNIRRSTSLWVGKVKNGTDRSFEQFHEMWQGLRAAMYLLTRYHRDYRWHTVKAIISHWAPASDGNNVEAYVGYVSLYMKKVERTRQCLFDVVKAMSKVESDYKPEKEELNKAWRNLPASMREYWNVKH